MLIGLAVGVDYSLFYIRREREERRAGRDADAALDATAATVGRAIVVSGVTVMVALAGLLVTGLSMFTSMALATMAVVAIAMIGSVTVLPAVLALLGDRSTRAASRSSARMARAPPRAGGRRCGAGWPASSRAARSAWLVSVVVVLGALAVPALSMHTGQLRRRSLARPTSPPWSPARDRAAFPGAPSDADLVVTGAGALRRAAPRERLHALGERARSGSRAAAARSTSDVARDGRTAVVSVPMPDTGDATTAQETVRGAARPARADRRRGRRRTPRCCVTGDAARQRRLHRSSCRSARRW